MSNTLYRTGDLSTMPDFRLPFPSGAKVTIQTYVGHDPDDKKMDMYAAGWPSVVAAAAGLVHEHFDPGGIEIDHGSGWFSVYLHMDQRAPVGARVKQGDWVGRPDTIGTWAKHLHHEHLYRSGAHDADTGDMVNPVIQGVGPMVLVAGKPIVMVSTNGIEDNDMTPDEMLDALEGNRGQAAMVKALGVALATPSGQAALVKALQSEPAQLAIGNAAKDHVLPIFNLKPDGHHGTLEDFLTRIKEGTYEPFPKPANPHAPAHPKPVH